MVRANDSISTSRASHDSVSERGGRIRPARGRAIVFSCDTYEERTGGTSPIDEIAQKDVETEDTAEIEGGSTAAREADEAGGTTERSKIWSGSV